MNKKKYPKRVQFNVRLTSEQLEELRRRAWDMNISISALVTNKLNEAGLLSPTVKNNA